MLIKDMLFGYYETQCLYAVTELKIADYLQHGPKLISELAYLTQVNEAKLYRIMRFMAAKQVFDELPGQQFQLNEESKYLVSTSEDSLNHFISLHAEYFYIAASELTNSLKSDIPSFELKFGLLASDYFKKNEKAGQIYNLAMKENSEVCGKLIAQTYDFSNYKTIVDIGGGVGSLLANILLQNQNAAGINFDLPELQKLSEVYFKEKQIAARCQFIGGDFFKNVPSGGDIYIMKAVLHGKSDEIAIQVLEQCRKVLPIQGKLLIIERIICKGENNYIDTCINDINMLNVTQGNVRTLPKFEVIFNKAGFIISQIFALQNDLSIIELEIKS